MTLARTLLAALLLTLHLPASAQDGFTAWVRRLEARGVQVSAGLWDLSTGKVLEHHGSEKALVPASTTKVVSTYALLKTWKPHYVMHTEVWGDLQGGVVRGDLILKGGGDPFFVSERIWALAQDLRSAGVRQVNGGLRIDQSAFDGQYYGNGWGSTSSDVTPPIAPLSVNFNRNDRGVIVKEPDQLAQATVRNIFQEAGIRFGDGNGGGKPRLILEFPSLTLRNLVQDVNKFSNNFMIEMLVKRFGNGSWNGGIRRIQAFYKDLLGLGPEEVAITDGSGLSKDNRLSARTLAIVLRAAWNDFEVGPEMVASLKVIGGEPWQQKMRDPNLERRVRCKTGYLSGVHSVCGYLQMPDGKLRVFAILLNGTACTYDDVWEQVSRWAN